MLMLLLYLGGSVLFALLRQQTNMALKTRTLLVKKRYLQIPSKGKYSKRSPQSSHRGKKVAEYTLEEMLAAKEMYEQNKALPLGQQISQRELAEASGIKLGTLSK